MPPPHTHVALCISTCSPLIPPPHLPLPSRQVCILNYKADGKPFWNQFFLSPLCDANDSPIFYVAIHCEVEASPLDAEIQQVRLYTAIVRAHQRCARESGHMLWTCHLPRVVSERACADATAALSSCR